MKSSYLTNLILLVIVIALLWLSQREQSTEQQSSLSAMDPDTVELIQIERSGQPPIRLERQQGQWVLDKPFHARANSTRISLLLSLLKASVHGEFQPMDPSALAQFKLNRPEVILSMNDEQFAFGGIESLSKNRYVMHRGVIYLIQDDVTPLLTASAGSFVDNRPIPSGSQIKRLSLPYYADADSRAELVLRDGQWQSDNAALSADSIKALVDSWQHAYAMQVHHLDETQPGELEEPQISLWLTDQPEPMQLVMRQSEQSFHLINPVLQLQYDFPLALQTQLLPSSPAK